MACFNVQDTRENVLLSLSFILGSKNPNVAKKITIQPTKVQSTLSNYSIAHSSPTIHPLGFNIALNTLPYALIKSVLENLFRFFGSFHS